MKKSLCNTARDICHGVLERRIVARMDDLNRDLTDEETVEECEYMLEQFYPEFTGYDTEYCSEVRKACRYILKKARG